MPSQPYNFRLNCIDYYQAKQTYLDPDFPVITPVEDEREAGTVPIIRVFGATDTGQKVCAHIHGALPYLYIEYKGTTDTDAVNTEIQVLAASINHALALSFRRNPYESSQTAYVAFISLVKGVPFYGYHVGYRHFFKIYLRNPAHMVRLADLLTQGAILARSIQPFESHLQYLLQWMCDYNLYGCGFIKCAQVFFRHSNSHENSISHGDILDPFDFPRQTHCTLEFDVQVHHILNRSEVDSRNIHQNYRERFLNLDEHQKFVPSMAGLWRDEITRRKRKLGLATSDKSPFPPEALVTMSADPRLTRGNWIHEDNFLSQIRHIIEKERFTRGDTDVDFETLASAQPSLPNIRTTYESIEDLYPTSMQDLVYCLKAPDSVKLPHHTQFHQTQVIVDESSILDMDTSLLYDHNDDDLEDPMDANPADLSHGHIITEQVSTSLASKAVTRSRTSAQYKFEDCTAPEATLHVRTTNDHNLTMKAHKDSELKSRLDAPGVSTSQPAKKILLQIAKVDSLSPFPSSLPLVKNVTSPLQSNKIERTWVSQPVKTDTRPTKLNSHYSRLDKPESLNLRRHQEEAKRARRAANPLAQLMAASPNLVQFYRPPPASNSILSLLCKDNEPMIMYKDAHYSLEQDWSDRLDPTKADNDKDKYSDPRFSDFHRYTRDFDLNNAQEECDRPENIQHALPKDPAREKCNFASWCIGRPPPSKKFVIRWVVRRGLHLNSTNREILINDGHQRQPATTIFPGKTQRKKYKRPSKKKATSIKHELQYMSVMSLEVHVKTRGEFVPNPAMDEISCIFWSIQSEPEDVEKLKLSNGIIMLSDNEPHTRGDTMARVAIDFEPSELDIINRLVDIVRDFDPDILVGYEVHNGSWGYVIERSRLKYEFDLCNELSRVNFGSRGRFGKEADRWGFTQTSTIRVTGRHMLNIWRAMRGELNLLQYTMENVVYKVLRRRIPHYSFATLTQWYACGIGRNINQVLNYFMSRTQLNLRILSSVDMVAKTSEQARLLGVDFFSVISRGSQFKVESLMFRIAKPESYVLISPSRKQVGQQNALECLPLVMEPQSKFYPSPLLVLDFQSLYPSIMIAYNYCYSTCLGRVVDWNGRNKIGFTDYDRQPNLLELLGDQLNIAPNGLVYVRPQMRKSLLARMLTEILETRVMVKSGMKQDKRDKALQRLLNNRQLALKLIANVTYGYTSASFSGRMPCSEIADSIVQSARETLERAIALIHSIDRWGAEVVYGDTDSLFVYLKGKSRDEAFRIGKEIADTVTAANPRPVKLKFEKVYHPCVLLAKKRYVGYKYEHAKQKIPGFDAKGIETVRRDGTPAEQRIEEKALRLLFGTQDLSRIKSYFQAQCSRILDGQINVQDFLFAKEVKLGHYSEKGPGPPGALVATRKMQADPRLEPQYGERVPYVVIAGPPGSRLIDRCVDPEVLLKNEQAELDAEYYITKNLIPPLDRIFTLVGANVRAWFEELPKRQKLRSVYNTEVEYNDESEGDESGAGSKQVLETYLTDTACFICNSPFSALQDLGAHEEIAEPDSSAISSDEEGKPSNEANAVDSTPKNGAEDSLDDVDDCLADSHLKYAVYEFDDLRGIICNKCLSNAHSSMYTLHKDLRDIEGRVHKINKICQDCSALPFGQAVACDSKDCPVYYARTKETSTMKTVQTKVRFLMRKFTHDTENLLDY